MLKFLGLGILVGIIIGFLSPLNISLINEKLLLIVVLVSFDVLFSYMSQEKYYKKRSVVKKNGK